MSVKSQQTMNKRFKSNRLSHLFNAAFKAGLGGGVAISLLLLVYQIAFPLLKSFLIPPAMIIVWIVTGIGAAMSAGERIESSREGGKVGVLAGLISGIIGGITAMVIAAFGTTFIQSGEGILVQISDSQLASLAQAGFTEKLVVLSGSIISALFVCGLGGMFVSALLGGLGGWLYPKFGK